jgi:hypothetical protein
MKLLVLDLYYHDWGVKSTLDQNVLEWFLEKELKLDDVGEVIY